MVYSESPSVTIRDGFFDLSKASHQLQQSFYSLGNGGINGVGLGSSSGKNLFL